ncbi:hypothetical protein HDV00_012621 [Rhizophlyctis rosea]|nr:hypothetical protein HDV00_012621 [Rhizophlyctis rosea]
MSSNQLSRAPGSVSRSALRIRSESERSVSSTEGPSTIRKKAAFAVPDKPEKPAPPALDKWTVETTDDAFFTFIHPDLPKTVEAKIHKARSISVNSDGKESYTRKLKPREIGIPADKPIALGGWGPRNQSGPDSWVLDNITISTWAKKHKGILGWLGSWEGGVKVITTFNRPKANLPPLPKGRESAAEMTPTTAVTSEPPGDPSSSREGSETEH